ncbi:glutamine-tRNA ligase [Flagelloscypha sp. PMI_526]|nr:glutamine-tRNA ligase [Flagelloscypha sp. PMI_526]
MSKPAKPPSGSSELVTLFSSIGLSPSKAAEAAKNAKSAQILKTLISTHDLTNKSIDEKQATLFVALSGQITKTGELGQEKESYIVNNIFESKLKSVDQVNEAVKFASSHDFPFDDVQFGNACGVGFSITPSEILDIAKIYVNEHSEITGWQLQGLRWANPLEVKNAVETAFLDIFGAKSTASSAKTKAKAGPSKAAKDEPEPVPPKKSVFEEGFLGSLHKPGGNPQIHSELREKHLATTGGAAIFVNFGYAAHHGGKTYLRYDDTNPEKEEGVYFESILEMIRWLGFEPWKITYSSDYFDELYELALQLIKRDKAYVCHCTQEQIRIDRGEGKGSPKPCIHRDRPISESLLEFEAMKDGKYRPKEANLRMKQDLSDPNPQMWDLTAYRILDAPHHRTGSKWKIYPTYDYTHCLVDSFENISHSLCTVEFVLSRQSYEWLCDALEVYKPRQSEYGRLNLEGTIMSKRKILRLVKEGYVTGWDDPRLYTLIALRRRGIPPGSIVSFVSGLGVSTTGTTTETVRFEHSIRQYLETSVPRVFMVLHPLKVTIDNVPDDYCVWVERPLHPKVPELGSTRIPFTKTFYIEADDFRVQDAKDYFRLAPGKSVGLFQAPFPVTYLSHTMDPVTGGVTGLTVHLENIGPPKKPKAFIQWVPDPCCFREPGSYRRRLAKKLMAEAKVDAEKRTAAALEASAQKETRGDSDDTPVPTADQLLGNECVRFQALRVAYFALDKDTKLGCLSEGTDVEASRREGDYIVLNRVVSLKEDSSKN